MTAIDRNALLERWEPLLEGIADEHIAHTTARLLENQAREFTRQGLNEEAIGVGSTTTGKIGTFQKFAFPMIRRMYPELIFNKIGATQAMDGPVSQIFYMGNSRSHADTEQVMYSKFNITPRNLTSTPIGSMSGVDLTPAQVAAGWTTAGGPSALQYGATGTSGTAAGGFDLSNVLQGNYGSPSTTMGGQLASYPAASSILGYSVSAAERLATTAIPEVSMHIQKQTVQARERKMRAVWTLEAAQDLKAYHNLDMEKELTDLLSKEMNLEIDRELIEDIRMIAYGPGNTDTVGGWRLASLYQGGADNFAGMGGDAANSEHNGGTFVAGGYEYDFNSDLSSEDTDGINRKYSNIYVVDLKYLLTQNSNMAPQHLGHLFSNVLAMINFASQDIYKTTLRGPGNVIITSPVMATMLESAAKLEGGIAREDGPTNTAGSQIQYKGKFAGKYDLIVDPMFPEDEIIIGYKGGNAMDAGFFYCPYVPLQPLDTVVDPETFQPRKGILTRYGKVAVAPASRFYRVIRVIGTGADWLTPETFRSTAHTGLGFDGAYAVGGDL